MLLIRHFEHMPFKSRAGESPVIGLLTPRDDKLYAFIRGQINAWSDPLKDKTRRITQAGFWSKEHAYWVLEPQFWRGLRAALECASNAELREIPRPHWAPHYELPQSARSPETAA